MNINTKFHGFEQSNSNITSLNSGNVNDELKIVGKSIKSLTDFMFSVHRNPWLGFRLVKIAE